MSTKRHDLSSKSPDSEGVFAGPEAALGRYHAMQVIATLQGSDGPLDVYIQTSSHRAAWTDYAHFPKALTAKGASPQTVTWTVSRGAESGGFTVVGQDLKPMLAEGKVLGGEWGAHVRVVFVAGAGTTAGAEQKITVIGTELA